MPVCCSLQVSVSVASVWHFSPMACLILSCACTGFAARPLARAPCARATPVFRARAPVPVPSRTLAALHAHTTHGTPRPQTRPPSDLTWQVYLKPRLHAAGRSLALGRHRCGDGGHCEADRHNGEAVGRRTGGGGDGGGQDRQRDQANVQVGDRPRGGRLIAGHAHGSRASRRLQLRER